MLAREVSHFRVVALAPCRELSSLATYTLVLIWEIGLQLFQPKVCNSEGMLVANDIVNELIIQQVGNRV